MTSRLLKTLVLLSVAGLVTGCKIAVMVPSGGDVTSASGTRNCAGGSLCEHNITDSTFNESFTAIARPGYVFTKWNKGAGFLCGDSTNPTCTISNVGTTGIVAIEAVIATGQFFYAMPLFEFVGIDTDGDGIKDHVDEDDDNDGMLDADDACPVDSTPDCAAITDTITVNGKEWAQVSLFRSLSWNDINSVCPGGICANGGRLNGHLMTGWTWAAESDLADLSQYYTGADPMFSCPAFHRMLNDGWSLWSPPSAPAVLWVIGYTSGPDKKYWWWDGRGDVSCSSGNGYSTEPEVNGPYGAWFYRD